jgi:citrate lyase subunit beta / citryl-CoA lyase
MIRPRRSVLFVPGANVRAMEKARSLPVDGIILDLEDAVAPEAKADARARIEHAVAERQFGDREVIIRVNGLDTHWWLDDVGMASRAKPDGILVPKISTVKDLAGIADRLDDINAPRPIRVWVMIETALGVLRVSELAAAATDSEMRLAGFVIGPNDIARETQMRMMRGRAPMLPALSSCVFAARAYGLAILDGVYNDFSDADGFAEECAQSRDMGFDGKTLIHPNQIAACNAAFTPPADEIAKAREIIALYEKPENAGRSAIQLNGQMVERLHTDVARRTIAIADAIAKHG